MRAFTLVLLGLLAWPALVCADSAGQQEQQKLRGSKGSSGTTQASEEKAEMNDATAPEVTKEVQGETLAASEAGWAWGHHYPGPHHEQGWSDD
eukprot:CAMPEP_0206556408 /NCGR_PEP_ID=MMETSP0325_2-20121206/18412_1 /ASSEMBLY_ACC=CAM_ASM_000347 /TAXON_ID=2866 /ORGANISM="Crypthecodinium cohnii, Strain Seligo" /LENGTH=92 /DNA_ID=CAMNT_0054056975 /DNA_START=73 /DNA_END=348 /DNA_ORIENTATION=+